MNEINFEDKSLKAQTREASKHAQIAHLKSHNHEDLLNHSANLLNITKIYLLPQKFTSKHTDVYNLAPYYPINNVLSLKKVQTLGKKFCKLLCCFLCQ